MPTNNSIDSNIPIEISKGGTNATSMANTDGVCYFDGTRISTTAVGTAAQVLTSNGTGVAPTFQSTRFYSAQVKLSSADIKTLHATPITLVAAQGANTVIMGVVGSYYFFYGGNNAFTLNGGFINAYYNGGLLNKTILKNFMGTGVIDGTSSTLNLLVVPDNPFNAVGGVDNVAIILYNPNAEISGNAADDNYLIVNLEYWVATLT